MVSADLRKRQTALLSALRLHVSRAKQAAEGSQQVNTSLAASEASTKGCIAPK